MAYILVIDDEEDIREYIQYVLELEGHTVKAACHGLEGIQHCSTFQIELVITDILMPVKEGLETIVELRRDFPLVRIIAMAEVVTRKVRVNLLEMAKTLGATCVLHKPFSIEELLEAVKEVQEIQESGHFGLVREF